MTIIHNPYQKDEPNDMCMVMLDLPYTGLTYTFSRSNYLLYLESFCRFKARLWCSTINDDVLHVTFQNSINCHRYKQKSSV